MSLDEIRHKVLRNREKIRSFGVNRIGFFGSCVRNDQKPDSDIDLLVFFEPEKLSFDSYINLTFFLEDLIGAKVDVLTPDQISPHIMPYIEKEIQYETI